MTEISNVSEPNQEDDFTDSSLMSLQTNFLMTLHFRNFALPLVSHTPDHADAPSIDLPSSKRPANLSELSCMPETPPSRNTALMFVQNPLKSSRVP